jgi:parallel beta-helix repeat protein
MKFFKSISLAMLLLIAIFITSCDQLLENEDETLENAITGDIVANTTWDEDEYIIDGYISISNATLTIAPGTIVKFTENSCLYVSTGGGLIADGTTEKITFTGTESEEGWWNSLVFEANAVNANCQLINCEIMYGGSGASGMIVVYNNATIKNCTISHSASDGIYVAEQKTPVLKDNTITDNAKSPVNLDFSSIGILDTAGGSWSGNSQNYIAVRSINELTTDATLRPMGIPFRFVDGRYWITDAVLTIKPGVTIEMGEGTDLQARTAAGILALGTSDSVITLTGVVAQKGYWHYVGFNADAVNADCHLNYCVIEYGGDIDGDDNGDALLQIHNNAVVENCIIRESSAYGVRLHPEAHPTFVGNTVTANAKAPVIAVTDNANSLQLGSGSFGGNDEDYILIETYTDLARNATWLNLGIPYRLDGFHVVGVNKTLTIAPGTTIEMAAGATLRIDTGAGLIADGTNDTITFTASTKQAGWWNDIEFVDNINSANCQLKNCIIEYGGQGDSEEYGLIAVGAYSAPTITGCLIRESLQSGIVLAEYSDAATIFISNKLS